MIADFRLSIDEWERVATVLLNGIVMALPGYSGN